ncbi:MAG: hypothetical protein V2I39_07950 [Erythrobacter sp.]|jgi:hypothetical protein|nr:hypothetical protein [Erythrobacter sp.]
MAKSEPITGPFPDGDSRNVTLTPNSNAFEPERTGPQEPKLRADGAPESVTGDLPTHKRDEKTAETPAATGERPETEAETEADDGEGYQLKREPEPSAAETAFGGVGGAQAEPVLQKDWNPAERNSDDLSR